MSTKTTEKLIHAFVTSRIDSCNALLFGIPEKDLSKLQTVQNCAARLIECAKRRDPVTPMLTRLHWLPVEKRIVYKKFLLCHKVLIHKSPTYLASVLTPYLPQQNLRSSSKQLLVVPTSSTCTYMGIVLLHLQHQFYGISYLIILRLRLIPVVSLNLSKHISF